MAVSGDTEAAAHRSSGADLLAIYLNDHFSGATGGLELIRRAAGAHGDGDGETVLTGLVRQLEEDREALARIMGDLGVATDRAKLAAGWLAEKAGRLKPNGHLFSRSPLSDVLEVEALLLGVRGKAACWRTLRVLSDTDTRLDSGQLDTLRERAEHQGAVLEEIHAALVGRTFRT